MVNQILIATTMVRPAAKRALGCGRHIRRPFELTLDQVGMVEGLLYGYKAGLDLNQVIEAVGKGAAGSWYVPWSTSLRVKVEFGSHVPSFA